MGSHIGSADYSQAEKALQELEKRKDDIRINEKLANNGYHKDGQRKNPKNHSPLNQH